MTIDEDRRAGRVGAAGQCRVVVCVAGRSELEWNGERYPLNTGDVVLLPAEVGECICVPAGGVMPIIKHICS